MGNGFFLLFQKSRSHYLPTCSNFALQCIGIMAGIRVRFGQTPRLEGIETSKHVLQLVLQSRLDKCPD